ncbi:beta-lactamase family protein [Oscillochloris sp. ZM17-4]|uniref:serine hydrolase domain-containing protein n=1 Tax=Oscillochloris sp. ZM17-4 TaxID=2866714 RepID=UPI001C739D82|nr:serine hydrolase domain-containing protein [Oscillochloris sp. ZM17-4]MBX0329683.1 beta-lactamase family protein [Oscillochloris sp. ZM17-4]
MSGIDQQLQRLIESESRRPHTHGVFLGVQSADGRVNFRGAAGDAAPDCPYFIASVTKMYTVAVLMGLADERRLDLDAPIAAHLPHDLLDGIHVHKGTDHSRRLTVAQLIHQTSGLPDYFEGGFAEDFKQNRDRAYSVADALALARRKPPAAAPDSGRSHYSDTNYQLLGAIVEAVTDQPLANAFQHRIFDQLGLADTYLYDCAHPRPVEPLPLYYKSTQLSLPLALSSERGTGGIVSTLADSLRFLRAYFDGELFDPAHFARMHDWNALFFPMQYGYGLMRFKLPSWMTLFRETPELIGHSGSTGSFAFYAPREQVYLAGTFNQFDKPSRPFNVMLRVVAITSRTAS